jgi:hypothetical protein
MTLLGRIGDKVGALGALVSAMGCAISALALMVVVSIRDLLSPAHRRCGPDGCELPIGRA